MENVLIINAHQKYPFAEGRLNASLVENAKVFFENKGHSVKITTMNDEINAEEELEKHVWADLIIIQTPTYWMGVPWAFKKYIDEVYSMGTMGKLCKNDGRTSKNPEKNYGTGGQLKGTKYMLSITFNAPKEAFNNPDEYLFQGKSVDDLFFPLHMSLRFFAMEALPTFVCYDVIKNPEIQKDFIRHENHLNELFTKLNVSFSN
ncbi:NAD(P)H-dependent oxidoreductase [Aureivirga marina]|uniref:NAD(P)H-dependent oxidoreductase n=1 Tax=Aureivirga marina TaxID=1182451 RepID=UPI0018CA182D|nr:NAD(P)H-dependent oxidoreductase [Aureivirga marina]